MDEFRQQKIDQIETARALVEEFVSGPRHHLGTPIEYFAEWLKRKEESIQSDQWEDDQYRGIAAWAERH